jgi:hypothetical protein
MVSVGLRGVFYEGKKQSVSLIQLSKVALSISPKGRYNEIRRILSTLYLFLFVPI